MAPPARTIIGALDMSKAFDTINIHTLIRKLLQKTFQAQSLSSSQTTSRDAQPTQHIEITHPNNVNFKLAFHKVVSFHPHYLAFTPQTYHHPVHQFRSWPTQTISHPHTQVRVQQRNTYNHTYIKFCLDKTKQPLAKSRQNNLHSVHTRTCKIYGPNNKQQSTTHGNAPKGSGSYLRPKTHIQHTHPKHLSTRTHTSTNHKSTHCNRIG